MPPEIECKVDADKAFELVDAILVVAKKVLEDKKEEEFNPEDNEVNYWKERYGIKEFERKRKER